VDAQAIDATETKKQNALTPLKPAQCAAAPERKKGTVACETHLSSNVVMLVSLIFLFKKNRKLVNPAQ
jgi:hypothetical protein